MRYRIRRSDSCVFRDEEWGLRTGWIVQVWADSEWVDVTRPYKSEGDAERVKGVLEK